MNEILTDRLELDSRATRDIDGIARCGFRWRYSPDEGAGGTTSELFLLPSLAHFGLPAPGILVGISTAYQTAEKYQMVELSRLTAGPRTDSVLTK